MVINGIHTLSSPLGDREGPGLFSKGRGSSKAHPKPAVPGHAVLDALRHFRLGLEKTAMSPCHWGGGAKPLLGEMTGSYCTPGLMCSSLLG